MIEGNLVYSLPELLTKKEKIVSTVEWGRQEKKKIECDCSVRERERERER